MSAVMYPAWQVVFCLIGLLTIGIADGLYVSYAKLLRPIRTGLSALFFGLLIICVLFYVRHRFIHRPEYGVDEQLPK